MTSAGMSLGAEALFLYLYLYLKNAHLCPLSGARADNRLNQQVSKPLALQKSVANSLSACSLAGLKLLPFTL